MSIGKRIKQRRIGQHLTQAQLADLIGTIKQTIYKYEHDIITNIPIERLKAIAKALNTSISYLVGATDEPDENSFASLALELAFFETARKEIDEETRVAIKAFLSEIKEAEKRLLKAAHEICHRTPESGIDDQSGPYNAGRIDVNRFYSGK